ncbi:MAG: TldD/PmbA family protein [Oligoflexia bacterium]|nr:TldD/PmbA family protein [Oligoflexia bacterium]MBF0364507.1 TldD/PmbA family protein [Oligoflexia bacterium]
MKTELCEHILKRAKDKETTGCELLWRRDESIAMKSAGEGKINSVTHSNRAVVGVRIIKDHRVGISYSEAMDVESLDCMLDEAINNSRFLDSKEYEVIDVGSDSGGINSFGLMNFSELNNDELFAKESEWDNQEALLQKMQEMTLFMESEIRARSALVSSIPYNSVNKVISEFVVANSLGIHRQSRRKFYTAHTGAVLKRSNTIAGFWENHLSRRLRDVDLEYCLKQSLQRANDILDARPIPTGNYQVVFSPETLGTLFDCFSIIFSSKASLEGHNPFKDKLGTSVANQELTISDRPLYPAGLAYSLFDDEGMMRKDMPLIERGILKNFYFNSATARYFKSKNNGFARRSPRGALDVSGQQQYISPGRENNSNLLNDCFYIIKLEGIHAGANPVSGEFSFPAQGYLYNSRGEVTQSVRSVTVAGNFYQMLSQIEAIGNQVERSSTGDFFAPKIRFKGLKIGSDTKN